MMRKRLSFLVALSGTLFACSNDAPVVIGDPIGSNLSDFAGSWDGYGEAVMFGFGGSDRIRLVVNESGEGTVEFGEAPLVSPPTDPDVGYPFPWTDPRFFDAYGIHDGFRYPIHDATLQSRRIRLTLNWPDQWALWCEMQTPVQGSNGYGCFDDHGLVGQEVPNAGQPGDCRLIYADGSAAIVDCGWMYQCDYICQCTESGCGAAQAPEPLQLDAALEDGGSSLVGTLAEGQSRITVRLHR